MTVTEKSRLEREQYGLELEVKFWREQQRKTEDEFYWRYTEGRIQTLNEKIDQIRQKLEGVRW